MLSKLRFSTFSLLLIMTIAACFVGAVSWAGRQAGLDGKQLATALFYFLVSDSPVLLVWIVGLVLLQCSDLPAKVSRPASFAIGGLLSLSLLNATFTIWWWNSTRSSTIHLAQWILNSLLTIVCWVFLFRSLLMKTADFGPEKDHSELPR